MPDLLAAADLAVVTSDWEARQLFAQEALRAGVPLVATAVGGLPDLVGDAAVLVPPGDVDALDAAVRELLGRPGGARGLRRPRPDAGRRPGPPRRTPSPTCCAAYAELTAPPVRTGPRWVAAG